MNKTQLFHNKDIIKINNFPQITYRIFSHSHTWQYIVILLKSNINKDLKMNCCTPAFTWHILPYQSKAGASDLYNKNQILSHIIFQYVYNFTR